MKSFARESTPPTGERPRDRPGWFLDSGARSDAVGIVLGGAPRSGTTLARVILDSHSDLACGPESSLFRARIKERLLSKRFDIPRAEIQRWELESASFPAFVARFLGTYARRQSARYWAEKTPQNVLNLGWILDRFSNVTFCHVVRDGRAVVNSLRTHPRHRRVEGRLVPTGIVKGLDKCIDHWLRMVQAGLEFAEHPRVIELRYEDLVVDPEAALSPLLARLGLSWQPEMMRFHEITTPSRDFTRFPQNPEATRPLYESAVGRWQQELTPEQVARIEQRGGHVLSRLGYTEQARKP